MNAPLTDWFPPDVRPVRIGVYQRDFRHLGEIIYYSYWDGAAWRTAARTVDLAKDEPYISDHWGLPWRGLEESDEEFARQIEAADKKTITLYSVQYCLNAQGVWSRTWSATANAAAAGRRDLIKHGCNPNKEMDGRYGCIGKVEEVEIELSAKGLLNFANNYAVDETS